MSPVRFISNQPIIQLGGSLIITDLHLGIEFEFRKKGIQTPLQHLKLVEKLNQQLEEHGADELVIMGDAKHDVYGLWERERRMFLEFLTRLSVPKLTVVRGNHDAHLDTLPEEFEGHNFAMHGPEGIMREFEGEKYAIFHGHAWPSKEMMQEADFLLMGHSHPIVEFADALGAVHRERAWIVGKTKADKGTGLLGEQTFVIAPAFNGLCGGYAFNTSPKPPPEELNGPLLANNLLDLDKATVRLLNGASVGKLASLRRFARKRPADKRFKTAPE